MATLDELLASAVQRHAELFGSEPKWIVAAPGRVNLIGEHIDYNDGFVLPMAIDRYCVIAASPAANSTARVRSIAADEETTISLGCRPPVPPRGAWHGYAAGVVAGFLDRGVPVKGFQAVVESNVPLGGGLSSSAALEVATATLLEAMTGTSLPHVDKALLCQKAEHEYAGVPCGIMDQFASVMATDGHLMLLDCRSQEIQQIPLTAADVEVLITNTNVKHELSGGEYAQRRAQCEAAAKALGVTSLRDATAEMLQKKRSELDDVTYRRARHVIGEIERTRQAADALRKGDWPQVGRLMYASHDSLRDDYEVSCPELDLLVDAARRIGAEGGVIGSRMTGGGFGGCTVSLVRKASVPHVIETLGQAYQNETGIEATFLVSRPAQGACVVGA